MDLAGHIDRPKQKWVCGNKHCSEPCRSTGLPDERVCLACGNEAVWGLHETEADELTTRLKHAATGDTIQYTGYRTPNREAEITSIEDCELVLNNGEKHIHIEELVIHDSGEALELGSALFYAELNPNSD